MTNSCCNIKKTNKKCKRKDGKIFKLPRRFTAKRCKKGVKGFTMRSSCAPFKFCNGGAIAHRKTRKTGKTTKECIAKLYPNSENINVNGIVKFKKQEDNLLISYEIFNLEDGEHGFHIHKCGDITMGCKSGCEHFNPYNKNHGSLYSSESHAGDLGNIISKNGISKGTINTKKISIDGEKKNSIIGRMIIVHAGRDDLGMGTNNIEESKKTGNAGKRLACGIIGIKNF